MQVHIAVLRFSHSIIGAGAVTQVVLPYQRRQQRRRIDERSPDSMTQTQWHLDVVAAFKANDIRLIAHVADRVLAPIIRLLDADPFFRLVTLTREEEGVGLLTGAYLGGTRGALLLQSSGFGNTLNALGSLAIPYQVPFVMLLSPRGGFHEHNLVQLALGKAVPGIVDELGLQLFEMNDPQEVTYMLDRGTKHAYITRRPVLMSISTRLSGGAAQR
jgi:sulfopyruvate decarboxylase alpha subunit